MPTCLIGLGANLGDREETLKRAIRRLDEDPRLRLLAASCLHQTAPVGGPAGQTPYLNAAAIFQTSAEPTAVLALLAAIEHDLGRARSRRWAPRTIDLDLLLYDQLVVNTPSLVLPHPRMAWRRFVLVPAAEVAGDMLHPTTGWTIARLLHHLDTTPAYVAIAGPIGAGKTSLARRLAQSESGRTLAEYVEEDRLARFYADPAGQAWQTELEFLRQRAELLAADRTAWADRRRLTVSDFWFDQSLAFARAWLSAERYTAYCERWQETRRGVVRPRLIVVLDATTERLMDRIRHRGRRGERGLEAAPLDRIRRELLAQLDQPDLGPQLRLGDCDPAEALDQASAAVRSMEE